MQRGYYTHTDITDFGPYVTKLILPFPQAVPAGAVDASCFSVYVRRLDSQGRVALLAKSWMDRENKVASQGYVAVKKAYPSDRQGVELPQGDFVTLEMDYGPLCPLSSRIACPAEHNIYLFSDYKITQVKPVGEVAGLEYGLPLGDDMPAAEGWLNQWEAPLNYGYYIPQQVEPGPRPLIIWLHGAGEGGQEPSIAYTANKVVALTSPKVQKLFGGAYVLAPQTPTFWMNDGSGEYGRSGKSMYLEDLKTTIERFIARNENIDRNRVYIGGDSNGGFMTMRMLLSFPELFAAAFPVCEALYDETITEAELAGIVHKPVWFTHAKNDPVVAPAETVEPTYRRLKEAGAENVHFTFWDKVEDIHEGFVDESGKPFEYMGHFTWIPMLNDDCRVDLDGSPVVWNGQEVTLLEWLAQQKKD